MKKLINILFFTFFCYNLSAQHLFSTLYYDLRLKENNSSFLPVSKDSDLKKEILGFQLCLKPIISSSIAFGNSEYNNMSFGVLFFSKINNKLSCLVDYEYYKGTQTDIINNFVQEYHIFPGKGKIDKIGDKYSFSNLNYRIAYNISKNFDLDVGQSKHFIGNGYRSLLLSDNSCNYPFLRFTTSFWKVKYTNLYTTFVDVRDYPIERKKHATLHYLDLHISNNLSLGIFESVIWQAKDTAFNRGYDYNYLNPIIFYRPVEFSLHSPDNVLIGCNIKLSIKQNIIYGQFLLDDLNISRQKNQDENYSGGFFQNKFAYQIGLKANEPLSLQNTFILTEFNQVQPYTYAHKAPMQNYTHLNQALAHPLGANFKEWIGICSYYYKKWNLELKWNHAVYGEDSSGTHFGRNIFISDFEAERDGKQYSYGNFNGQGVKTTQDYITATIYRQAIQESKIYLYAQIISRKIKSHLQDLNHLYFLVGIKTNLHNSYFDF